MKFAAVGTAIAIVSLAAPFSLSAADTPRPEIGTVNWGRDFDGALAASAKSGKPVFAFFQEVPGCAGCRKFGREVMSHPLLAEAIESEFEPVVIFNNQPGKDREILERFGEPAWNYQVIRFLDSAGKDLIPRKDRVWTFSPLVTRMIAALKKAERPVPRYLRALADESETSRHEKTAFAMFCFWTGEMKLGALDSVVSTEAGWIGGREVTLVTWHQDRTDLETLIQQAAQVDCADKVFVAANRDPAELKKLSRLEIGTLDDNYRTAQASDQKKQLPGTPFAKAKMTAMQRTKVNALARIDPEAALEWLSPTQSARVRSSRGE